MDGGIVMNGGVSDSYNFNDRLNGRYRLEAEYLEKRVSHLEAVFQKRNMDPEWYLKLMEIAAIQELTEAIGNLKKE